MFAFNAWGTDAAEAAGTITIKNNIAVGNLGETFEFNIRQISGGTFNQTFHLSGLDGENSQTFDLDPGSYLIRETIPSGWRQPGRSGAGCMEAFYDSIAVDDLKQGQNITCTFTNKARDGTITIIKKVAFGDSSETFDFQIRDLPHGEREDFWLNGDSVNSKTFNRPYGTYEIREWMFDLGWSVTGRSGDGCILVTDDPNAIQVQLTGVNPHITCTFTNEAATGLKLTLTAEANFVEPPQPGNKIDYKYEVENTGEALLSTVWISDSKGDVITCGSGGNTIGNLRPGTSQTCTATYQITQDDIDAGLVTNEALADDKYDTFATAEAETDIKQVADLELGMSVDPDTYSAVGEELTYTYEVTNNGNVTLTDVTITGSRGDPCTVDTLDPNQSQTCDVTDAVTQSDVDEGTITNAAQAQGNGPDSSSVESNKASVTADYKAAPGSLTIILGLEDGSLGANQRFGFGDGNLEPFSLPSGGNYEKTFDDLQSGKYDISQVSQPNKAWSLASISCDAQDYSVDDSAVTVNLIPGEDATCTFTARFDAVDTAMAEETLRFIYRRVDNLLSHGPDRSRLLRRLQTPGSRSSQGGPLKFSGT
ncbi:MAG: hypothetical protein GY877_11775, partial [Hyphomicrobium sp.]|nr:hypothetical protein [Hyphomicrobium sp.]